MLSQLRQQISEFWEKQSAGQRMLLIVMSIAGLVLIPTFITWANTPSYASAFSGLPEAEAGKIVEKLDEAGIPYRLQGGGTILVPSNQVYDVRLRMAREGLPETESVGFELFSGNTLGMTDFSQRVNYQNALEGELERTIGSLGSVEAVRVHIVTPERSLLTSDQAPATASVTIKEKPGIYVDASQVRSITHLVASSVENLDPEHVVVVDVDGNLLAAGLGEESGGAVASADNRRAAELAAAVEIQKKVQHVLDSSLGPNRAVVQAFVTLDWTEKEIVTNAYDPETGVLRSSQVVTENYQSTGEGGGGIPGAETNLPEGFDAAAAGEGAVVYERQEETNNYELTQIQTVESIIPGEIEHVSLSVLVDGVTDQQQLATLQAAVSTAAGINLTRGDVITVESIDFDRSYYEENTAELEANQERELYFRIGEAVAVGLILLALLFYVQRLLNRLRKTSSQAWTPVLRPVSEMAGALPGGAMDQYSSDQIPSGISTSMPELAANMRDESAPALPSAQPEPQPQPQPQQPPPEISEEKSKEPEFAMPMHAFASESELVVAKPSPEDERLQRLIERLADDDPNNVAEVVRLWLNQG